MKKKSYFIFAVIMLVFTTAVIFLLIRKTSADNRLDSADSIQRGSNNQGVIPDVNMPVNCMDKENCISQDSCKKHCCCKSKCIQKTGENGEVPVGINPHLNNTDTNIQKSPPPQEVK